MPSALGLHLEPLSIRPVRYRTLVRSVTRRWLRLFRAGPRFLGDSHRLVKLFSSPLLAPRFRGPLQREAVSSSLGRKCKGENARCVSSAFRLRNSTRRAHAQALFSLPRSAIYARITSGRTLRCPPPLCPLLPARFAPRFAHAHVWRAHRRRSRSLSRFACPRGARTTSTARRRRSGGRT